MAGEPDRRGALMIGQQIDQSLGRGRLGGGFFFDHEGFFVFAAWQLTAKQRQQASQLVAHFPTIDDHVQRAVLLQEFAALKAFGEFLAYRLFDDAGAGEADQGIRFGNV